MILHPELLVQGRRYVIKYYSSAHSHCIAECYSNFVQLSVHLGSVNLMFENVTTLNPSIYAKMYTEVNGEERCVAVPLHVYVHALTELRELFGANHIS